MRHKPFKIELCYSISNFMFRSRGQHEVRRSCWNRGREKIKLDVERFIDLTSKSHWSSTNSVISGTNSLGRFFFSKFKTRTIFRQTTKLHFSLLLKRSKMDDLSGKWTLLRLITSPMVFCRKFESLYDRTIWTWPNEFILSLVQGVDIHYK